MAITAKEVNDLRQLTGAGMMDCKKALTEANGDVQTAIEILRKKGQKISESRKDREAKEGSIFAHVLPDGRAAVMLELNCETDFVARNEDFQGMGNKIVSLAALQLPADLPHLLQLPLEGKPVAQHLVEAMARVGEKIDISKYELLTGEQIISYIHPGARIGVLVAFEHAEGAKLDQIGRDVAMQVASMNPLAIDKDGVDASIIQKEIEIGKDIARQEGKPEAMLEKIALGKLNKFYKDRTLINQEFVKDPSKTIAEHLKSAGPKLRITAFSRMHLGYEE